MDIEGVNNVINYDMPAYIKTYIHRAGRTARAGQTGRCFTLLQKDQVKRFGSVLQKAGNESCAIFSVPSESVELYQSHYSLGNFFLSFGETEGLLKPKNTTNARLARNLVLYIRNRRML